MIYCVSIHAITLNNVMLTDVREQSHMTKHLFHAKDTNSELVCEMKNVFLQWPLSLARSLEILCHYRTAIRKTWHITEGDENVSNPVLLSHSAMISEACHLLSPVSLKYNTSALTN